MYELDKAWLDNRIIHAAMKNDSFAFAPADIDGGDAIRLQLQSDIINWLQLPLMADAKKATVVLEKSAGKFDNDEAFQLSKKGSQVIITGNTTKALMYGFYELLREKVMDAKLNTSLQSPSQPLRMIDHWDQTDGSIERGYAGASIFFGKPDKLDNPDVGNFDVKHINGDIFRHDRTRMIAYARMLASVGINAVSLNNVNVREQGIELITPKYLDGVDEIATIFRGFGIKTFLAINWASPKLIGGLETSDPVDPQVQEFWANVCDNIYSVIPDFGGFVVKADSEGEPGPYQYGRDHAQGANMLGQAIKPHGGLVIWRAFVYNAHQDWRDRKTDRAKAAYNNFVPLDGHFADNVILQMKFGPIDFQTAEPLQPLFGKLRHTNQMMEFEISAEYLGHQIDVNYAVKQWYKMLNYDTKYDDLKDPHSGALLKETAVNPAHTGMAAVGNVGMSEHWTNNPLAQANLYGYGRLCWNNQETPEDILHEWVELTFKQSDSKTKDTIFDIVDTSNDTYKDYCAPLGIGFMVVPHYHYGPSVNGYEYDRWGTYHFADRNGVGVDRTMATGSGFIGMYSDKLSSEYENLETTPKSVVLFLHHVPYDHVFSDGKTLIQTIYDLHFKGYENVEKYIEEWATVSGKIDDRVYEAVSDCLKKQLANALEWRDQVNTYFYRMSGVPDDQGRLIYE